MNKKLYLFSIAFLLCISVDAQTEAACYTAFKTNPATAVLPDYSFAGYHFGADSIPNISLPVFDVTKYGAIPDDTLEDFDGVQAAINAATAAGGGIIFFPKGKFLMNEMVGRRDGINIPKGNIILRGSGSGAGGTELFMKNYMLPTDSTKLWTVPSLFHFYYYQGAPVKTQLASDAKRGEFKITVANASSFKAGNMIEIQMTNPAANNELLAGLTPYPEWTTTINTGISILEKHKIAGIAGNVITLSEPLNINMTASYTWNVALMPLTEGLGVEDIWFHGNFQEIIVHHKNFIHDAGWSFIRMDRPINAFLRRLRFTDSNVGISLADGYACTIMHIRFDGNPGHSCVAVTGGTYGILTGFIDDATNSPGFWHGPGPSATASGTVIWRYRGQSRSGPESHASYPYYTLIDASTSKYIGNGGDAVVCPNHGKDFTYWNHKEIGTYSNIAFWENHLNPPYGNFVKIVYPNVVGWQGKSTFVQSTLGIYESYGKAVLPESLYEAQLALRLGYSPAWISAAKKVWANYLLTNQWPTNSFTTDIITLSEDYNLNISIQPQAGGFSISGNCMNARYKIYMISGQIVQSGILKGSNQTISMTPYNRGVYFVSVQTDNWQKLVRKLVW